jgi:hypothetical protein
MSVPVPRSLLLGTLAEQPLLDSIRDALTSGPHRTEILALIGGAVAFIVVILIAARLFGRDRSPTAEPQVDYLTLAVDVLALSESDRRDLQRIAWNAGLQHPVAMLLSPTSFAHAVAATLARDNDPALRQRLDALSLRLFETPLAKPDEPAAEF